MNRDRVEAYDKILDLILDFNSSHQASVSMVKHHKLFPELQDIDIEDLLDEMAKLASPRYLKAKPSSGGKITLFMSDRTARLKEEGGFQMLVNEKVTQQERRVASVQALTRQGYFAQLHPEVQRVASNYFADGHFKVAVLETCTALSEAVEAKSGLNTDNTKAMLKAFSPDNPILKLSDDKGQQQGFMYLYAGSMMAIRNKLAHQSENPFDQQTALEWLSFLSALFRLVDQTEIIKANQ